MNAKPSAAQLKAFSQRLLTPVALVVQFNGRGRIDPGKGRLLWSGRSEQILCGLVEKLDEVRLYEFGSGADAIAFTQALPALDSLEVIAISTQPRSVKVLSALMARVLPRWPFDNTEEDSEEPGIGVSSTMPTREAVEAVRTHPDQTTPVTMVNWLKFKPGTGRDDYHRYGKVALLATHSLGAKLIYVARYLQTLIGNGGDPGPGRWSEFALMQYPGRATFGRMARLKRYRAGLHHREAGLAENGQGLVVTKPAGEFTWR